MECAFEAWQRVTGVGPRRTPNLYELDELKRGNIEMNAIRENCLQDSSVTRSREAARHGEDSSAST